MRHFTRAQVEQFVSDLHFQEQVVMVMIADTRKPLWVVTLESPVGYHSTVLVTEELFGGIYHLMYVICTPLPGGCATVAEENKQMQAEKLAKQKANREKYGTFPQE